MAEWEPTKISWLFVSLNNFIPVVTKPDTDQLESASISTGGAKCATFAFDVLRFTHWCQICLFPSPNKSPALFPHPSPAEWYSSGCTAAPAHLWWACGAVLSPFLQETEYTTSSQSDLLSCHSAARKHLLLTDKLICNFTQCARVPTSIWRRLYKLLQTFHFFG